MKYTTNYNFKKPDLDDSAKITDINDNMDVIDTALKSIEIQCPFPVGSVLPMMTDTDPSSIWSSTTWQRVGDGKFIMGGPTPNQTGGSNKITEENLPPHNHYIANGAAGNNTLNGDEVLASNATLRYITDRDDYYLASGSVAEADRGKTSSVGNGEDFLPSFITMCLWNRTA